VLEHKAQNDKPRFARFASRMDDSIATEYFDAILRGVVAVEVDKAREQEFGAGAKQPLATELLVGLIRRVHALPDHPCGRWLCWAVRKAAKREFPSDIFEIVAWYAINDPNPDKELWQTPATGETPYYGGDPVSAGMNSTRGAAAEAIAGLLFADKNRWSQVEVAVVALVKDGSLAVRSCTVECLLALLNLDRERAVQLFLQLVQDAGVVLGTHPVDHFLHYATYSHYDALRSLMLGMLSSGSESARKNAARQIAVAAFHHLNAQADMSAVLSGDEHCREAAANVYAVNLQHSPVRDKCREHLVHFFNDPSKKVRDTACFCFRHLTDDQLSAERELIFAFVESLAFRDDCDHLLYTLNKSTALLPDVVCAIGEKLITLCRAGDSATNYEYRRGAYKLPDLVIRLYNQTYDIATKRRCLDLIDQMLELGFDSVESELTKVER
jgi:hypothetical protein